MLKSFYISQKRICLPDPLMSHMPITGYTQLQAEKYCFQLGGRLPHIVDFLTVKDRVFQYAQEWSLCHSHFGAEMQTCVVNKNFVGTVNALGGLYGALPETDVGFHCVWEDKSKIRENIPVFEFHCLRETPEAVKQREYNFLLEQINALRGTHEKSEMIVAIVKRILQD
jgi:hypothetical protein